MTRWAVRFACLVVLLVVCGSQTPAQAANLTSSTVTSVNVGSAGTTSQSTEPYFAPGGVTFSTEAYELGQNDLTASNASLVNYFRQLGPGVLRIGGDTADNSWWTSSNEAAPSWAIVTVTPADLTQLDGFLSATGWRASLTVDLGHYDPARAANEVVYASQILGPNLAGIEIGNEPNDYGLPSIGLRASNYSLTSYATEFQAYASAIEAAVPGTKLLGPDSSSQTWYDSLAQTNDLPVSALTEHFYPTSYSVASGGCTATPVPTAQQLLSPTVMSTESALAADLVSQAGAAGLPAQISETNDTSSCDEAGGPDTSPVFASAIWAMDWSLRATSAGVSSIAFHDEFGTCGQYAYSALCTPNSAAEALHQVAAQPEYLGLVAASDLEGGRFVPVAVTNDGSPSSISAYATVNSAGKVELAIINSSFTSTVNAQVTLPETGDVATSLLEAPSPMATTGATFNIVSSDSDESTTSISLPPISAAVVTLRPTPQATATVTGSASTTATTTSRTKSTITKTAGAGKITTTNPSRSKTKAIHTTRATTGGQGSINAARDRRRAARRLAARKIAKRSRRGKSKRTESRKATIRVHLTAASHGNNRGSKRA